MSQQLVKEIETSYSKKGFADFKVGDTVKVKVLIREGNKERNQNFEGMVIAVKGGGINKSFTVRRIFQGVAIERTFMVHSPKVVDLKVVRKGKTRRAKLYYIRERIGTKATRLREDTARIAKDFQAKLEEQQKAKQEKKDQQQKQDQQEAEAEDAPVNQEQAAETSAESSEA